MFNIKKKTLPVLLALLALPMVSFPSGAAQGWGEAKKEKIQESGCPDLAGYYFFVTPSGGLGGTTVTQRLVGEDTEYTFTDQGPEGKPEKSSTVYLADGKKHDLLYGNYLASCKGGTLAAQLAFSIPEGDLSPASYEGKRLYSIVRVGGVTYLSVEIDAAAKILAPSQATPVKAKYFARRIGN